MNRNILLDTDSYKTSHWLQYPPGATDLFHYVESRGGVYDKTVFFGLQYLLKEYLSKRITYGDVIEAEDFYGRHGVPFNTAGWGRIALTLGGRLPVIIKALPEGTVTPTRLPLLTVQVTDPQSFWVGGWLETLLMRLWYPITVATLSYTVKDTIKRYLTETGDPVGLPFKLHDFGSRGVSSRESAAIGGAAHLVNFMGSDTVPGVVLANEYYRTGPGYMAGYSIPAAEHSTITAWGRDGEVDAYRNMLKQFAKPGSVVAIVSDSYDIYNAVENLWGHQLRQEVIDSCATVVIRPDSGDPILVVNTLLHTLERRFGSVVNAKGYKVLNNVRIIQGDGVNPYTIGRILESARVAGFSADNVAFGMGGALLQQVNRDTLNFAMKCSSITLNNGDGTTTERDVYKEPVGDKSKASKRGRIGTKVDAGKFVVCSDSDPDNLLQPVFDNGEILTEWTFEEIRYRSEMDCA